MTNQRLGSLPKTKHDYQPSENMSPANEVEGVLCLVPCSKNDTHYESGRGPLPKDTICHYSVDGSLPKVSVKASTPPKMRVRYPPKEADNKFRPNADISITKPELT
jgi:hypothetical protein